MIKRDKYIFLFAFYSLLSVNVCFAKNLKIDIGLYDSSIRAYFSADRDYSVFALDANGKIDETLMKKGKEVQTLIRFGAKTNERLIVAAEPDLASSSKPLLLSCADIEPESDCIWTVKENKFDNQAKKYRGSILIKANVKDFTIINRLYIEDYLKGVVASEMPASWHKEALKAQSVAARTYTVSKLNRRARLGYDLKPTVEDQVYLGVNNEHPSTNEAVKDTEGLILVDKQNRPVQAYFFSRAGFATGSAADIWGTEHHEYLRPQFISDDTSPWQMKLTLTDLNSKLNDLRFSAIKALSIINRTPEGRAKDILISGNKSGGLKHLKLTGEELRHKLGLRSTFFTTEILNNNISFNGVGFGHGIGMSQHGAKKLAEEGKNFKQILDLFYEGSSLMKL